jgi:hypothetical protein
VIAHREESAIRGQQLGAMLDAVRTDAGIVAPFARSVWRFAMAS